MEELVSLDETSPGEIAKLYGSADLRILSFYEVNEVTPEDVKCFVDSFPDLEELSYCGCYSSSESFVSSFIHISPLHTHVYDDCFNLRMTLSLSWQI